MAKLGWCVPCGVDRVDSPATQEIDGEPVCGMHARIAAALEAGWAKPVEELAAAPERAVLPGEVCSRGCGNAPHRGRCAGAPRRVTPPEPAPISESFIESDGRDAGISITQVQEQAKEILSRERCEIGSEADMDFLVCEEIPASQVPSGRERNIGRLGQLWTRLMATDFEIALKVKCRDADHAGSTARHMTLKARKAGVAIVSRRVGDQYYCHRVRPEAKR